MPDMSRRDTTPELMDTESVSFEDFSECLRQLAGINALTFAHRPTLRFFDRLLKSGLVPPNRPLVVVDAGSGYGDMLRKLDSWASGKNASVDLVGVDVNPWSARAAAEATESGRPIRWITSDLFAFQPEGGIDVIISSLFAHHLKDELLIRFVAWMEGHARLAWFINDLERGYVPYYAVAGFARLTRRHRFVRHDGPVSVASAFKYADWSRYAAAAGLPPGTVEVARWHPYRICVSRTKGANA